MRGSNGPGRGSERDHELPQETVVLDAGGRFAIPGLFDMHGHAVGFFEAKQEAFLAYGVTSVRDVGRSLSMRSSTPSPLRLETGFQWRTPTP